MKSRNARGITVLVVALAVTWTALGCTPGALPGGGLHGPSHAAEGESEFRWLPVVAPDSAEAQVYAGYDASRLYPSGLSMRVSAVDAARTIVSSSATDVSFYSSYDAPDTGFTLKAPSVPKDQIQVRYAHQVMVPLSLAAGQPVLAPTSAWIVICEAGSSISTVFLCPGADGQWVFDALPNNWARGYARLSDESSGAIVPITVKHVPSGSSNSAAWHDFLVALPGPADPGAAVLTDRTAPGQRIVTDGAVVDIGRTLPVTILGSEMHTEWNP
jgi:hypothetical protein